MKRYALLPERLLEPAKKLIEINREVIEEGNSCNVLDIIAERYGTSTDEVRILIKDILNNAIEVYEVEEQDDE